MTQNRGIIKPELLTSNDIPIAGDITGLNSGNTVVKLNNVSVSSTAPSNTNLLTYTNNNWQPNGPLESASLRIIPVKFITSNYTIIDSDHFIIGYGGGAITVTFPASTTVGREILVCNINASSYWLKKSGDANPFASCGQNSAYHVRFTVNNIWSYGVGL